MRAAVMRNKKIVVDEVAAPIPATGEVLVKTLACGICGSDLHALKHADKLVEGARRAGGPFITDINRDIDLTPFPRICRICDECNKLEAFERVRPELQPDAP